MGKPDPRAEPDSIRAPKVGDDVDHSVDRVISDITAKRETEEPESGIVETKNVEPKPASITNTDPRWAELEPLVETSDWKTIVQKLGAVDDAGKLPPNLGLIVAIAHNEMTEEGTHEARTLATRCTAGLMGLPVDNEIVRILSRRMLRKNVVRLRERQAPPARWSAVIVVVVLALGGALGWFLSTPYGSHLMMRLLHIH